MRILTRTSVLFLTVFLSLSIMSCGSDSSSSTPVTTPVVTTISGTAATGKALAGFVYVVDATGTEINAAINDDGSFSIDVAGMKPPYMVKAVPNDTSIAPLFSFASNGHSVNVTPMTNLAMFLASNKADLDAIFNSWDGSGISIKNITTAKKIINANLQSQYATVGLDATIYDFFTREFSADSTGIDKVLDSLKVTVELTSGIYSVEIDGIPISFDESIDTSEINIISVSGEVTFSGDGARGIVTNSLFSPDYAIVTASTLDETQTGIPGVTATASTVTWTDVQITDLWIDPEETIHEIFYTYISFTIATYESELRYSLTVTSSTSAVTTSLFIKNGKSEGIAGVLFNEATGAISFNNVKIESGDPSLGLLTINGSLGAIDELTGTISF